MLESKERQFLGYSINGVFLMRKKRAFTLSVIPAPAFAGVNLSPPKRGAGIQIEPLVIPAPHPRIVVRDKLRAGLTPARIQKRKESGFTHSVIPAPHRGAGLTPAGIQMKNKKGFTLIELLVVIAIIALLLSILTPALNSVKERAKRLLCLNALRQSGIAITSYSAVNDNLMFIPRRWGGVPFAHYMAALPPRFYGTNVATPDMKSGEFSVYAIDPYIDCVGKGFEDTGVASGILACPAIGGDFMVDWAYACWDDFCSPPHPHSPYGEYFIEPAYSYWVVGRKDSPIVVGSEASANILRDLTIDTLSSKRLLMSEVLCMDESSISGKWAFRYNHGRSGWSWCLFWYPQIQPHGGHEKIDGEQDATGRSQLFGDGHVQWRDISLKPEDNIPSEILGPGFDEENWNGPGSGWIIAGLVSSSGYEGLFSWY